MSFYERDEVWVSPLEELQNTNLGDGSSESPFSTITEALKTVHPGSTIVLQRGNYSETVTINQSGTIDFPITIRSYRPDADDVICGASWYLYDASDIIMTGITFKNTQFQAISVIGACQRNNFNGLHFIDCGTDPRAQCTLFFGGSDGRCTVVEKCGFHITTPSFNNDKQYPVGIMITEGCSSDEGKPNTNHIFRNNTFFNYGCAIIIGTSDAIIGSFSHIVENNLIQHCSGDGIRVKCGDTIVRGNRMIDCRGNGIAIITGNSDAIYDNRIENCSVGIRICGYDCTVANNCIIRSGQRAIIVAGRSMQPYRGATTLIEHNSCINSNAHSQTDKQSMLFLDTDSSCVVRKNLFYGSGVPYASTDLSDSVDQELCHHYIIDNVMSEHELILDGCEAKNVVFTDILTDNYTTDCGWGAKGSVVQPVFSPLPEVSPESDAVLHEGVLLQTAEMIDEEAYLRSLLFESLPEAETLNLECEDDEKNRVDDEDTMVDFSTWD
ncbi:MAG: right-handed parallel beta-helix repeat-containing protein [Chitinivibrionales bacterium]|nr:right-handed parallel beta-helix repeat-containing protein [Chitinivibrionales bacterium]